MNTKKSDTIHAAVAHRVVPQGRWLDVPPGQNALLVRLDRPEKLLSSGRHKARGLFQPAPECYLYPAKPFPLFLWIAQLYTSEGKPINLSWKLSVRVVDPEQFWESWLRFQKADQIPAPDSVVSGRMADTVQELVSQFHLETLRTDPQVRQQVAEAVRRIAQQEMEVFGLELARPPDSQQLRFVAEEDRARAAVERETLRRMVEDAQLQTLINRMDNAEALAYRLREWLDANGRTLSEETLGEVVREVLANEEDGNPARLLEEKSREMARQESSSGPVMLLETDVHGGFSHIFHHLGQFVGLVAILAALVIGAIAVLEPHRMDTPQERNWVVALVVSLALIGVVVAWTIDRIIHWQAQRSARQMLDQAHLSLENDIGRLELSHTLRLVGALLAIAGAGIAFWLPGYYPWLRIAGAALTLVSAAIAVRLDWLRTMEHATRTLQSAQRRVTSVRLDTATRAWQHRYLQADLAAEIQVALDHLDKAKGKAFRNLRNRPLYARLHRIREELSKLMPAIQSLEQASWDHLSQEPEVIAQRIQAMREEIHRSSDLAQAILWHVQQAKVDTATQCLDELELSAQEMQALLTRWQAVTV